MRPKNINREPASKKAQMKRDHREHYDIDGVTRQHGKIVIPSNLEVKKEDNGKDKGSFCKIE